MIRRIGEDCREISTDDVPNGGYCGAPGEGGDQVAIERGAERETGMGHCTSRMAILLVTVMCQTSPGDTVADKMRQAMEQGFSEQQAFESDILNKGREILAALQPTEKLFVLISRPYNGCDEGMNLELPDKLAELGVRIIPMDMLDFKSARLTERSMKFVKAGFINCSPIVPV